MDQSRRRQRVPVAAFLAALAVVASMGVSSALASTTWSRNLYNYHGVVFQDPYPTACTAAAAMTMLNLMSLGRTGGDGFVWRTSRIQKSSDPTNYRDMTSILYFERGHDTLRSSSSGSDPHGWRNALNYYGWGKQAMVDPAKRIYDDLQFTTFSAAVRAAVRAIARHDKPVGMLGWAGRHAQVITGYVVTGANPAVSNDFTVRYIYLTDPLRSDGFVNTKISMSALQGGNIHYRFRAYREADSPYDDGYSSGWRRSSVMPSVGTSEWYGRWVIIAPVRDGVPASTNPTPTPSPTPSPTPTPTPEPPDGDADPNAAAAPTETSQPTPIAEPTETAQPTASPVDTPAPTPDQTATPNPSPETPVPSGSPDSG
jgi:hypothetical protein